MKEAEGKTTSQVPRRLCTRCHMSGTVLTTRVLNYPRTVSSTTPCPALPYFGITTHYTATALSNSTLCSNTLFLSDAEVRASCGSSRAFAAAVGGGDGGAASAAHSALPPPPCRHLDKLYQPLALPPRP
eukprot:630287-Rhodomonas_salina.1